MSQDSSELANTASQDEIGHGQHSSVAPISNHVAQIIALPSPLDARRTTPGLYSREDDPYTPFWRYLDEQFNLYPPNPTQSAIPIIQFVSQTPAPRVIHARVPRSLRRVGAIEFLDNMQNNATRHFPASNRLQKEQMTLCRALITLALQLFHVILRSDIHGLERLSSDIQEILRLLIGSLDIDYSERDAAIANNLE